MAGVHLRLCCVPFNGRAPGKCVNGISHCEVLGLHSARATGHDMAIARAYPMAALRNCPFADSHGFSQTLSSLAQFASSSRHRSIGLPKV